MDAPRMVSLFGRSLGHREDHCSPNLTSVVEGQPESRPSTFVSSVIAWVYKNAASFGGNASRFYIGGHSSGGHLCGVTMVTDWQKDFGLPADIIKGGLCMSGMYDEFEAPSRFVARASDPHLWNQRDTRIPAPEPRFCRGSARRRQAGRVDRSGELQPFRNGRIARQSLWSERTGGACDDETCTCVSEIARQTYKQGRLRVKSDVLALAAQCRVLPESGRIAAPRRKSGPCQYRRSDDLPCACPPCRHRSQGWPRYPWLAIRCSRCKTPNDVDLARSRTRRQPSSTTSPAASGA